MMVVTYTIAFTYILQIRTEGLSSTFSWVSSLEVFSELSDDVDGSVVEAERWSKWAFPRVSCRSPPSLQSGQFLLTIAVFLRFRGDSAFPHTAVSLCGTAGARSSSSGCRVRACTLTSFFRDVRHILEIALGVLFWTTPILYQYDGLPELVRLPILLSPMSAFVVGYQQIFHAGRPPDLAVWLAAACYGAGMFVLGATLFVSTEDRLAEQV